MTKTKIAEQFSKIDKVVVNTGIGRLSQQPNFNDKILPAVTKDFTTITGQKPSTRPAKQSISGFKLRQGTVVGLKATLRRKRMADFINRVSKIVLPRVRDFRGLDIKNVDECGNLSFGIKDYLVFPEIKGEESKANFGVEITVVPKSAFVKSREEAIELYRHLGLPLKKS